LQEKCSSLAPPIYGNFLFILLGSPLSDGGNYDFECIAKFKQRNPVLLYDLNSDPGERYPLDTKTHTRILRIMKDLRKNFTKTVPVAPRWSPCTLNS